YNGGKWVPDMEKKALHAFLNGDLPQRIARLPYVITMTDEHDEPIFNVVHAELMRHGKQAQDMRAMVEMDGTSVLTDDDLRALSTAPLSLGNDANEHAGFDLNYLRACATWGRRLVRKATSTTLLDSSEIGEPGHAFIVSN